MAKTILIADDIAFVRKTLTDIFSAAHYEVIGQASDGKAAVDLYAQLRPDLVTLDLVMPKMSGIEAARQIMKIEPRAKLIMITAMSQENLVMEAINAGIRDYILKPFEAQEILRVVDRILSPELSASRSRNLQEAK